MSNIKIDNNSLDIIKDMINNIEGNEFEVRFGNYNKGGFRPGVNFNVFNKIQKELGEPQIKMEKYIQIYDDVRSIEENGKKKWERKYVINKEDIPNYNIRFALSKEDTINEPKDKGMLIKERKKTTYCYIIEYVRYDLSIIEEKDNKIYDIEIEIIKKGVSIEILISNIEYIIKNIQESNVIISQNERKMVLNRYKKLTRSEKFVGALPVTLNKNNMMNIIKQEYSVTDKADGERRFMIMVDGNIYFMKNNMDVQKTEFKGGINNTILDGEFINNNLYSIFDIIVCDGMDIRGNIKYKLKNRLRLIEKVLPTIKNNSQVHIQMKKYIIGKIFEGSKLILDYFKMKEIPYKIDGLIFTPVQEYYPEYNAWKGLLKWKSVNDSTIDFLIKKRGFEREHEKWDLLMKTNRGQEVYTETMVQNGVEYEDNTVIEFKVKNGNFIPIRTRWDKTYNKRGGGNYINVVNDIMDNIKDPITEEMIIDKTKYESEINNRGMDVIPITETKYKKLGMKDEKRNGYFINMRKFHNWIKQGIINIYTKDKYNMLDLACGKGGDLYKWEKSDIKRIVGIDINEKYIEEAKDRISGLKSQKDITLYQLDLSEKLIREELKVDEKFDVINCQFAIHYFFKNEDTIDKFFRNVTESLKDNGIFIGTVFDGLKIFNKLNEEEIVERFGNNGELLFRMEKGYNGGSFTELNNYGEKVGVFLGGDSILYTKDQKGITEYLVNFNTLISIAKKYELELIESTLFTNYYRTWITESGGKEMDDIEKEFSFLNRTFVFRKLNLNSKLMDTDEIMNCLCKQSEIREYKEFQEIKYKEKEYYKREELIKMKVDELKKICRNNKLKATGKKKELVDILVEIEKK